MHLDLIDAVFPSHQPPDQCAVPQEGAGKSSQASPISICPNPQQIGNPKGTTTSVPGYAGYLDQGEAGPSQSPTEGAAVLPAWGGDSHQLPGLALEMPLVVTPNLLTPALRSLPGQRAAAVWGEGE